jgi:hypothetical protein
LLSATEEIKWIDSSGGGQFNVPDGYIGLGYAVLRLKRKLRRYTENL